MTYKFIVSHHTAGAGMDGSDCLDGGSEEHYHLSRLCMRERRDEWPSFTISGTTFSFGAQIHLQLAMPLEMKNM